MTNEEIKALFAARADVVQIDESCMQVRPEKAKQFGVKSLNIALEGVTGTTAVRLCFGYTHMVHDRPSGYSFLPSLRGRRHNSFRSGLRNRGSTCPSYGR